MLLFPLNWRLFTSVLVAGVYPATVSVFFVRELCDW